MKAPGHPLARGVAPFTIPKTSMFAEPFRVPEPEAVVPVPDLRPRRDLPQRHDLERRRKGRVAYFRPGHDGLPVFFHPSVRQAVANAASLAARRA